MSTKEIHPQIWDKINASQRVLVAAHIKIDGDGLGAMLAFYALLKKMGKEVIAYYEEEIPESYSFLAYTDEVSSEITEKNSIVITLNSNTPNNRIKKLYYNTKKNQLRVIITPEKEKLEITHIQFGQDQPEPDLIVVLDIGELERVGEIYKNNRALFEKTFLINIDHHPQTTDFGNLKIVDTKASSTCEIMYALIKSNPVALELMDAEIATLLMTGILADTGNFQFSNTSPSSLEAAGELLKLGAKQQEIVNTLFRTKKISTLKIWGKALERLRQDEKYRIIWTTLSQADFEEVGIEDEGGKIIDELITTVPDADFYFILKETETNLVKGSLRAKNGADANLVAQQFGGGGHVAAAAMIFKETSLEEAEKIVLEKIRAAQKIRLNLKTAEPSQPTAVTPSPATTTSTPITTTPKENVIEVEKVLTNELKKQKKISV